MGRPAKNPAPPEEALEQEKPEALEPDTLDTDPQGKTVRIRMITTLAGPGENYNSGSLYTIEKKRAEELIKIGAAEKE